MKTKKSPKADMERNRSLFFSIGLVFALASVLLAFNVKSPLEAAPEVESVNWEIPEDVLIPITRDKPEPKRVVPPVTIDQIVVDLDEGQEEANFDDFTDEIESGELIYVNPALNNAPEPEEVAVVSFADQMPEFPGGVSALRHFIGNTVNYPVLARENGVEGTVYIQFVVNTDGTITDAFVARSADSALEKEALRVINSMPRWKPGMQNGIPVRVRFTVPINFVLQ